MFHLILKITFNYTVRMQKVGVARQTQSDNEAKGNEGFYLLSILAATPEKSLTTPPSIETLTPLIASSF